MVPGLMAGLICDDGVLKRSMKKLKVGLAAVLLAGATGAQATYSLDTLGDSWLSLGNYEADADCLGNWGFNGLNANPNLDTDMSTYLGQNINSNAKLAFNSNRSCEVYEDINAASNASLGTNPIVLIETGIPDWGTDPNNPIVNASTFQSNVCAIVSNITSSSRNNGNDRLVLSVDSRYNAVAPNLYNQVHSNCVNGHGSNVRIINYQTLLRSINQFAINWMGYPINHCQTGGVNAACDWVHLNLNGYGVMNLALADEVRQFNGQGYYDPGSAFVNAFLLSLYQQGMNDATCNQIRSLVHVSGSGCGE